jgi:hypothetical protein
MNNYTKEIDKLDEVNKRQYSKIRPSYLNQAKHINDNLKNLGYEYIGNIYKNGTSPELWANPQQIGMIGKLEGMIVYLLETSKTIKKWFSIAHSKSTIQIN